MAALVRLVVNHSCELPLRLPHSLRRADQTASDRSRARPAKNQCACVMAGLTTSGSVAEDADRAVRAGVTGHCAYTALIAATFASVT